MSDAYEVYLSLTSSLERLIENGLGDGEEAEEIRDQMDGPWFAMTEEERESFRK